MIKNSFVLTQSWIYPVIQFTFPPIDNFT